MAQYLHPDSWLFYTTVASLCTLLRGFMTKQPLNPRFQVFSSLFPSRAVVSLLSECLPGVNFASLSQLKFLRFIVTTNVSSLHCHNLCLFASSAQLNSLCFIVTTLCLFASLSQLISLCLLLSLCLIVTTYVSSLHCHNLCLFASLS